MNPYRVFRLPAATPPRPTPLATRPPRLGRLPCRLPKTPPQIPRPTPSLCRRHHPILSPLRRPRLRLHLLDMKITWNAASKTVIYRSKRHYNTKRNFEIFKAPDFIAAALLHLPPKGQQTVRYVLFGRPSRDGSPTTNPTSTGSTVPGIHQTRPLKTSTNAPPGSPKKSPLATVGLWFSKSPEASIAPSKQPLPKEILARRPGKLRSRSMISGPKSPHAARSRPTPEDFSPKHRPPTHRITGSAPFSPATPISPPSGPARRLAQGPPVRSKFLAATISWQFSTSHWERVRTVFQPE